MSISKKKSHCEDDTGDKESIESQCEDKDSEEYILLWRWYWW